MALQLIITLVVCALRVGPSTQTYADDVCAKEDTYRRVGYLPPTDLPLSFTFICNREKNAIRKCIPDFFDDVAIAADGKSVNFGGHFGNEFTAACKEFDGPTDMVHRNFGEQVCSTTKEKAKSYTMIATGVTVKVTFICDGMKIAFCKPDKGMIGKIKAGKTEVLGGTIRAKFEIFCQETKQPEINSI